MKPKQSELDFDIIEIYSDGACAGNPGPGGFGWLIRYLAYDQGSFHERIIEGSGAFENTTNNRMEMIGALEGLLRLEAMLLEMREADADDIKSFRTVKVTSDSSYLCSGFTKGWVKAWKRNGWITSSKQPVKNVDLWQDIEDIIDRLKRNFGLDVRFICIPGHKGYTFNERCDRLAYNAARNDENRQRDINYENLVRK